MKYLTFIIFLYLPLLCSAGQNGKGASSNIKESVRTSPAIILAKVADRNITLDDFIQRSEYTLRAPYCKGNTNIDKNIILNTLIAEKLFAIESHKNNELLNNSKFLKFIEGRKEQKMRELLYYIEGKNKVKLDTSEIKKVFSVAGRTYNIEFYNIYDKNIAKIYLEKFSKKDSSFENFFLYYNPSDSIRSKRVSWESNEIDKIHKALFSGKLKKNDIIGPVNVNDTTNLLIKIKGWDDRVVISEKDIKSRYDDVVEKLTSMKADSIYEGFILKVMDSKKINFKTENLNKLVNILAPFYLNQKKEDSNEFLELVYKNKNEIPDLSVLGRDYDEISLLPLFEVDNKTWTIDDLRKEIEKHPLVFRKANIKDKFANQLWLAIIDLVRDKYLTQAAYDNHLDSDELVKHYEQSWFDASMALSKRNSYLKSFNLANTKIENIFEQYLNPYFQSLLKKYSDQIQINVEEYNKIKLSRIDMFTTQPDVPYPIYVPVFPQLTTYNRMDYGSKMEK